MISVSSHLSYLGDYLKRILRGAEPDPKRAKIKHDECMRVIQYHSYLEPKIRKLEDFVLRKVGNFVSDSSTSGMDLQSLKVDSFKKFSPPFNMPFIRKVIWLMVTQKQIKIVSFDSQKHTIVQKGKNFRRRLLTLCKEHEILQPSAKDFHKFIILREPFFPFSFPLLCLRMIFSFCSDQVICKIRMSGRLPLAERISLENEYCNRFLYFLQGKETRECKRLCKSQKRLFRRNRFLTECLIGVSGTSSILEFVDEELLDDRQWMEDITNRVNDRCFLHSTLSSKKLVLEKIRGQKRYEWDNIKNEISEKLLRDRDIVMEILRNKKNHENDIGSIEDFRLLLRGLDNNNALKDREIVLLAVKKFGGVLQDVSEELRNDKEVVIEAIKQFCMSLLYASEELKSDKEVVLEAVKRGGLCLQYACEELKGDREVVLEAVKQNGEILYCVSDVLKNDEEVVLEAVKSADRGFFVLANVSKELRSDKEFVLKVLKLDVSCLRYFSEELKKDEEIIQEFLKGDWHFGFASDEMQNDKEFVLEAIRRDKFSGLFCLSEELKNDKDVVLAAIRKDDDYECSLENASEELKGDREVVLEAIKKSGGEFKFASDGLKRDREFALECAKVVKLQVDHDYDRDYEDFLMSVSDELRNDFEFFRECCLIDITSIDHILRTTPSDRPRTELVSSSLLANKLSSHRIESSFEEYEEERYERIQRGIPEKKEENRFVDLCEELIRKLGREYVTDPVSIKLLIEQGNSLKEELKKKGFLSEKDSIAFGELKKTSLDLFVKIQEWNNKCLSFVESGLSDSYLYRGIKILPRKNLKNQQVVIPSLENKRFSDLRFLRLLGRGSFGSAYLCRIDPKDEFCGLFVVKLYQQTVLGGSMESEKKNIERDSLYLPSHLNIVPILHHRENERVELKKLPDYEEYWKQILDISEEEDGNDHNTFYTGGMVIMKYYTGSLRSTILGKRLIFNFNPNAGMYGKVGNIFKPRDVWNEDIILPQEMVYVMGCVISGANHLHSNLIVHRDLHTGNIFFQRGTGRILIGDYGCCLDLRNNPTGFRVEANDQMLYMFSGSYRTFDKTGGDSNYSAPEILQFNSSKDDYLDYSKSDLYSCGVVGKELFNLMRDKYQDEYQAFREFLDLLTLGFKKRISIESAKIQMIEFINSHDFGFKFK